MALTPKQQAFVAEYLIDLNATQAAIRAGYSEKTAQEQASRLLSNVIVSEAIQAAMQERSKRTEITQDMVLRELARIGFSDIRKLFNESGSLKRVEELDDDAAAFVSSVEVVTRKVPGGEDNEVEHTAKIKMWDKRAALVDVGKHLGMFKETVNLNHGVQDSLTALLGEISDAGRPTPRR